MDLEFTLKKCSEFIIQKGDEVYREWDKVGKITYHDAVDFSTDLDLQIEHSFHDFLKANFPNTGFIGEEDSTIVETGKEYVWHLDPIDGTKYFARQVPLFSITLALERNGEGQIGLIYLPTSKQLYSAIVNKGAFLNGKQIKCIDRDDLQSCIINVEMDQGDTPEGREWIGKSFETMRLNIGRLRIFAQVSQALSWIAKGALDGYVDLFGMLDHDKYVDIAAGLLICKEAGVDVYSFTVLNNQHKLIVAPPTIAKNLLNLLKIENATKL